jgi:hypothetical protein
MPGLENQYYGHMDLLRWAHGILYPQNLALTSPTSGSCSVSIVRSLTLTIEFFVVNAYVYSINLCCVFLMKFIKFFGLFAAKELWIILHSVAFLYYMVMTCKICSSHCYWILSLLVQLIPQKEISPHHTTCFDYMVIMFKLLLTLFLSLITCVSLSDVYFLQWFEYQVIDVNICIIHV